MVARVSGQSGETNNGRMQWTWWRILLLIAVVVAVVPALVTLIVVLVS